MDSAALIAMLERETEAAGGSWGINHVRRLLALIDRISDGLDFDRSALTLATYLHDWGGYPEYSQDGREHYDRSVEVAAEVLEKAGTDSDTTAVVLDAIAHHHSPDPDRSPEAKLLADADALDFLGPVGFARIFSKRTKNLKGAFDVAHKKLESCSRNIQLDAAKPLAKDRAERMRRLLEEFERDSFGFF